MIRLTDCSFGTGGHALTLNRTNVTASADESQRHASWTAAACCCIRRRPGEGLELHFPSCWPGSVWLLCTLGKHPIEVKFLRTEHHTRAMLARTVSRTESASSPPARERGLATSPMRDCGIQAQQLHSGARDMRRPHDCSCWFSDKVLGYQEDGARGGRRRCVSPSKDVQGRSIAARYCKPGPVLWPKGRTSQSWL